MDQNAAKEKNMHVTKQSEVELKQPKQHKINIIGIYKRCTYLCPFVRRGRIRAQYLPHRSFLHTSRRIVPARFGAQVSALALTDVGGSLETA